MTLRYPIGCIFWLWDGSRLDIPATREGWRLVPDDGIAHGLVCLSDNTFRNMSGADKYFLATAPDGKLIWGHNNEEDAQILRRYPDASIKYGKWTSEELLSRIAEECNAVTTQMRYEAPCENC